MALITELLLFLADGLDKLFKVGLARSVLVDLSLNVSQVFFKAHGVLFAHAQLRRRLHFTVKLTQVCCGVSVGKGEFLQERKRRPLLPRDQSHGTRNTF